MITTDTLKGKDYRIYFMDCVEGMKKLPEESVDLIIADPPFGIDFNGKSSVYNRDKTYVVDGYKEIYDNYTDFSINWLGTAKRVLKKHGIIYVFSSWNNLFDVLFACRYLGLAQHSHLTWSKTFPVYKRWNWVDASYHILMLLKYKSPKTGKPKHTFNKIMTKNPKTGEMRHYPRSDLRFPEEYKRGKLKNSTKLPNSLIEYLIRTSSKEGDMVLDPFVGNGTTAVECLRLNRRFIGYECNIHTKGVIENAIMAIHEKNRQECIV